MAASGINTGDTAWLLISTALVMLMTPGLALFYGGMVQRKNVLSTFMHCFFALGIVSVQWAVIGYSLAFGKTHGGIIGGFDYRVHARRRRRSRRTRRRRCRTSSS